MGLNHDVMNKHEVVEKIIVLLDSVTVSGSKNVVALCTAFQMLYALQQGLKDEDKAKNRTIDLLKEQLRNATTPHTEPGGDVVGGEHYDLNFGGDADD